MTSGSVSSSHAAHAARTAQIMAVAAAVVHATFGPLMASISSKLRDPFTLVGRTRCTRRLGEQWPMPGERRLAGDRQRLCRLSNLGSGKIFAMISL
jgi:hypothetical protein